MATKDEKCRNEMGEERKKEEKECDSTEAVDMIGNLPDDIISHVLSFLLTREMIRTSVLSSRWRSLWKSVPTLEFSDDFDAWSNGDVTVRSILAQRETKLTKSLVIEDPFNSLSQNATNTLVSAAVSQNVEEISFYRSYEIPSDFTLPNTLLTCQTLTSLKLSFESVSSTQDSIHLPSLKVLHVLLWKDDGYMARFISGCPALEELLYQDHFHGEMRNFYMNQKGLNCDQYLDRRGEHTDTRHPLVKTKVGNMSNLLQAYVSVEFEKEHATMFFNGIRQTRFLALNYYRTIPGPYAGVEYPEFQNLVYLDLCFYHSPYGSIIGLLAKCPVLERLEFYRIRDDRTDKIYNSSVWTYPDFDHIYSFEEAECTRVTATTPVPTCLNSHLTSFTFEGCGFWPSDIPLTNYILKNAKVLKNLFIEIPQPYNSEARSVILSKFYLSLSTDCNYQIF